MQNNKMIVLVVLTLVLLLSFTGKEKTITTVEGDWDISEQVKSNNYEQYLVEEKDFDYTNPMVFALAQDIKSKSSNSKEAVKDTIDYVVHHIRYSSAVTISYCYSETASSVLETGIGDCVSMSRLVTALLRAQGIPARTVGGCLSAFKRCTPLFALIPYLDARVTPMTEGDFKKRGFLHEYVEAWTPEQGWFLIEATSGQTFGLECNGYISYSYDTNERNRCVINDRDFWNICKDA